MSASAEPTLSRHAWVPGGGKAETERLLESEWLVTNGLGGYASGTIGGVCTRRFHGYLVAALPAPMGRRMMFNHLAEEIRGPDGSLRKLRGEELREGIVELPVAESLAEFRLEMSLPVWRYRVGEGLLEKRVWMPRHQNTVMLRYRLLEGAPGIRLRLRPSFHFRPHGGRVDEALDRPYPVFGWGDRFEIRAEGEPALRLMTKGKETALVLDGGRFREIFYRREARRGYDAKGPLWSPGYFRADLGPGQSAVLCASTEDWEELLAIGAGECFDAELRRRHRLVDQASAGARNGTDAELVLAADQFLVLPTTRRADGARARAVGEEAVTMIAGYPWFTDWGRDSMISLEGIALATGRWAEAAHVLRTFGRHLKDGLIPNHFPEGKEAGVYNTADATLWFVHALDAYVRATGDRALLRDRASELRHVVEAHVRGTSFGIRVDPADGLLVQGEAGSALTWMDARMGDWVVTPRRGKAVEINALWYHALRILESWARGEKNRSGARLLGELAEQARESFNRRFWNPERNCLFDVVDGEGGDDASIRPNQIFAISLPNAALDPSRWEAVLGAVERELLTPVGLRTLAPGDPSYRPTYDGDLRARDAAYHQGTVWPWLLGAYVDARLKVRPGDVAGARRALEGLTPHLSEACVGTVGEIFDAEPPYHPRGCVAQAWSVAELLRARLRTA